MSTKTREGFLPHDATTRAPRMSLARFANWLRRLSDRRSQLEPDFPMAVNRRSDWLAVANARMTDDGSPPREP